MRPDSPLLVEDGILVLREVSQDDIVKIMVEAAVAEEQEEAEDV